VGQLSNPLDFIVDTHDNVLVADSGNKRVQLLSPTLTYFGDILIPGYQLGEPNTLYFDQINHRLYIREWTGGHLFILGNVSNSENNNN